LDIVEKTNGAEGLIYQEMITRVNQKFEVRNIAQTAGLYCSAEQLRELFLL
jgi:hypothetical protein